MTKPNAAVPERPITIRDRVIELYTDAEYPQTIAEISRQLAIGRETVREHLIRANVPRRVARARRSRDKNMVAQAVGRYRKGETLWDIGNDLGKTATTVRLWLIEAGVERRPPGVSVNAESLQQTIRLYESGLTLDQVAARQGIHPWTVRQRLVNADVPRRGRGRQPDQAATSAQYPEDAALAELLARRESLDLDELFPHRKTVIVECADDICRVVDDGDEPHRVVVGGTFDELDSLPSVTGASA